MLRIRHVALRGTTTNNKNANKDAMKQAQNET